MELRARRATGEGTAAIAGKTGTSRARVVFGLYLTFVCESGLGFDDNQQLGLTAPKRSLPLAYFLKRRWSYS